MSVEDFRTHKIRDGLYQGQYRGVPITIMRANNKSKDGVSWSASFYLNQFDGEEKEYLFDFTKRDLIRKVVERIDNTMGCFNFSVPK